MKKLTLLLATISLLFSACSILNKTTDKQALEPISVQETTQPEPVEISIEEEPIDTLPLFLQIEEEKPHHYIEPLFSMAELDAEFGFDTLSSNQIFVEDSPMLALLDSLAYVKFFTDDTLITDQTVLNIYNYAPNEVPKFTDSIYEARINALNLMTPMELTYNTIVKNYIDLYANKRRKLVSKMLGLAQVYFPLFEESLDKYNMPLELKYLAIVESALNPTAGSKAGAKGLWQFMYGTGKVYGLQANSIIDDRYDPIKATDAACRHLCDLYKIYGNWSLSLAAYNSGAGNVNKALRRSGGVKSYWAVWAHLPRETRGYVPAFIAVNYVMNYAPEHNIYPLDPGLLYKGTDTVMVNDAVSFEQISEYLNISMDTLKFLNPAYKIGIIPAVRGKKYALRLPYNKVGDFINNEQAIYDYKSSKGKERDKLLAEIKKAQDRSVHYVRSGENLGLIARRYRVSVKRLKQWNGLRSDNIYPGQKLIVYPTSGYSSSSERSNKKTVNNSTQTAIYTVRNGDNLGKIGKKYSCSITEIKQWNGLKGNTIHVGQKLKVRAPQTAKLDLSNRTIKSYTVKSGDNLWTIAKQFSGVSYEEIKTANKLTTSRLKIGQKLKIPTL